MSARVLAGPAPIWPALAAVHTLVFDFDGVFTDNKVFVGQDGQEWVRCDRADGMGLDFLKKCRRDGLLAFDMFILSKETNAVVKARAAKLGLECRSGVGDKLGFLENYLREKHPGDHNPFSGLVYLGNDLNDLPVIERAGFSVAPGDAHPLVKAAASVVLERHGGDGFVREFIEHFLGIGEMSKERLHGLVRSS